jgi:formate hydrogenlyase transcriptional activator
MEKEQDSRSAPEERNILLALAAAFEGDFSIDWLEELTGMKASVVLSTLEGAVERQVLTRINPGIYVFKDHQTQQRSLNELSPHEKERCHREIATILIRELPDDEAKVLRVAEHLLHLSNDWTGCEWLLRAGDIYAGSLPTAKAIACYGKVLNDLFDHKGDNEDRLFIKAAMGNSINSVARRNISADLASLNEARERAKRLHDQSSEILLEMHIAKYERFSSGFGVALERFDRAFLRASEMGDPGVMASTTVFSTYFLFWQGRFRDVIEIYEKSVPDVERCPVGQFPLIAAMMVGRCYAMTGQLTQGLGMADAVRGYCLQRRDLYLAAHAGANIAMIMLSVNRFDDALHYSRISLKEAETADNYSVKLIATLMLAFAHYMKGSPKEALHFLRLFLKNRRGSGEDALLLYPYLMEICWAVETGALPGIPGLSFAQEIDRMLKSRNIYIKGVAYRHQALSANSKGWTNQKVTRLLAESAKWLGESGGRIELAKTQLEFARCYLSVGSHKKAKTSMALVLSILSPSHMDMIPDDLRTLVVNQDFHRGLPDEILDLTTQMVAKRDNRRLLQQIVTTANRVTGAERGAILLLNDDSGSRSIEVRASKNLTVDHIYHPSFTLSRKIMEEVAASGKGRIFEFGSSDGKSVPSGEIVRSSICVPVILDERVVGVLYHDNRLIGNVFKESDLAFLTYCAALAAVDLDREKVYQENRLLHERREDEGHAPERSSIEVREVEGIVGTSPALQQVMAQVARVAKTDSAVLILGETGVGKSLVAKEIHRQSLRNDGPFIMVQCSALTESLITSELFGHERGAFTGATYKRIGRFELADKGTLFLDEIGDLSLEVQARLLRVLQSKEFERVGGGKDILTSDFRLLAATNRNLIEEIKAKRFREDLYYRINVFPLCIPPLRERTEDIPPLAHHFLKVYANKQGTGPKKIPREVMEKLVRHDWPGNIRELENVIQRGIIASAGTHFQLPVLEVNQQKTAQATDFCTLAENERRHILEALNMSGWKIHGSDGAAGILDINPFTLVSRMKKLGISKPPRGTRKRLNRE